MDRKKVLAISGSTRQNSTNKDLLKAIAKLSEDTIELIFFEELSQLPHFNPDDDNENIPDAVRRFRQQLKSADGVIICTPEYAMGLPGTLKNAIDWTVSSCEFSHKPVAAITASTSGKKAHESLIGTLNVIEAKTNETTQLLISHVKTKVLHATITDEKTLDEVKKLIASFSEMLAGAKTD